MFTYSGVHFTVLAYFKFGEFLNSESTNYMWSFSISFSVCLWSASSCAEDLSVEGIVSVATVPGTE